MVDFLDLRAAAQARREELLAAAAAVIDSGWFILGEQVAAFEREFAAYCDAPGAVGVANGLDAISLALRALGIGPGDEVIVPSNTYIATWLAVSHVGAIPVAVEPDEATYNLDPARVEAAITPATRAIIAVHLYGQPADLDPLRAIADTHGLALVEDAAQAHGARYKGRRIGSGDRSIVTWSFYPGKNLGALGDGGALTAGPAIAADVAMLRNYGSARKYEHELIGYNSRLDEMQAAFLRAKLPHLDAENERRRTIAARYTAGLAGTGLILPFVPDWAEPVWHLYVVRHPDRDGLAGHLKAAGIGTVIHYPTPPHLQPAYAPMGLGKGSFPISERIHREVLSLPIGPMLTDGEVDQVIDAVRRFG